MLPGGRMGHRVAPSESSSTFSWLDEKARTAVVTGDAAGWIADVVANSDRRVLLCLDGFRVLQRGDRRPGELAGRRLSAVEHPAIGVEDGQFVAGTEVTDDEGPVVDPPEPLATR